MARMSTEACQHQRHISCITKAADSVSTFCGHEAHVQIKSGDAVQETARQLADFDAELALHLGNQSTW